MAAGNQLKKGLLLGGFIILGLHFGLIAFYCISPGKYSNFYTYPFFHQNWNLFVPPPTANYALFVSDNTDLKPTDVLWELTNKHQSNRFAGNEAMVIALTNGIHYFEKEALEKGFTGGKVEGNNNFNMIEKMVKAIRAHKNIKPGHLQVILVVSPVNSEQKRVYYN